MIDLHSHILPGIDDGAPDIETALEMARIFCDQGVHTVACTPHILPGVYHNTGSEIRSAVDKLQIEIFDAGIDLKIVSGADNHVVPDFVDGLQGGHLLSLADSRYVLVEPPHHVAPPRLSDLFFSILVAGYVPVLTHPERLSWIDDRYEMIQMMAQRGVWMQITSGSLVGRFGKRPKYWAERMVCEGLVHILASDAHNCDRRPPDLLRGRTAVEKLVGSHEADNLVALRAEGILQDKAADGLPHPQGALPDVLGSEGRQEFEVPDAGGRGGLFKRVRNLFTH